MTFVHPSLLWLLLLVPVLYGLIARQLGKRRRRFERFAEPSVWPVIAPDLDWGARLRKARVLMGALALAIVALARPQWGAKEEVVEVSGLDIMLALDVSNSMAVEDVVPDRLKKAKHLIRTLLDNLGGDRAGIVAFAGSSFLASPLTNDIHYLSEILDTLGPESITNQGTDIGTALETAARALQRGAEEELANTGVPQSRQESSRIVVLISDGEDLGERVEEGLKILRESGARLYVFGVGTEAGGPVPVRDRHGVLRGYKKHEGEPVVSRFRPKPLMDLASAAGGKYWTVTPAESEAGEFLQDIGGLTRDGRSERRYLIYQERFQYPLLLAILLILFEMAVPLRKSLKEAGLFSRGTSARKAAPLILLVIVFGVLPGARPAFAAPSLDVYLENEDGVDAFRKGEIEKARRHFGKAQAKDPDRAELLFNQGVIQMQQDEVDNAISGFSGAADRAAREGDAGLAGQAYYNLGSALAKKGKLPEAIDSFVNAIEQAEKTGNEKLVNDTRRRLEQLVKQQQQQQSQSQQNQQDQQQDDQQQQANQDPQQDQDGQQGQDPQQEKKNAESGKDQQEPKKYSQGDERRKFKSQSLNAEDAERVMNELANREKDLQSKLRRQEGGRSTGGKDW